MDVVGLLLLWGAFVACIAASVLAIAAILIEPKDLQEHQDDS